MSYQRSHFLGQKRQKTGQNYYPITALLEPINIPEENLKGRVTKNISVKSTYFLPTLISKYGPISCNQHTVTVSTARPFHSTDPVNNISDLNQSIRAPSARIFQQFNCNMRPAKHLQHSNSELYSWRVWGWCACASQTGVFVWAHPTTNSLQLHMGLWGRKPSKPHTGMRMGGLRWTLCWWIMGLPSSRTLFTTGWSQASYTFYSVHSHRKNLSILCPFCLINETRIMNGREKETNECCYWQMWCPEGNGNWRIWKQAKYRNMKAYENLYVKRIHI